MGGLGMSGMRRKFEYPAAENVFDELVGWPVDQQNMQT